MVEQSQARMALWRSFMEVPHKDYNKLVPALTGALGEDPDFTARACVYMAQKSAIRDQQDCAIVTLLQSDAEVLGDLALDYRNAGQALLLGNDVYSTEPGSLDGLPPFRIFRIERYIRGSSKKLPRRMAAIMGHYYGMLENDHSRADGVMLQNRSAGKAVWRHYHMNPEQYPYLHALLYGPVPEDSKLGILKQVANADNPREQMRLAVEHKLDDRILQSVLDGSTASWLIRLAVMTPTQAQNVRARVEQLGLLNIPEFKEAYVEKVGKATKSVASADHRKSTKGQDKDVQAAVDASKEKSIAGQEMIGGQTDIYLDHSYSMQVPIEEAPRFAERILPLCEDGKIFIHNDTARELRVVDTGHPYQDVRKALRGVVAGGGTLHSEAFRLSRRLGRSPDRIVLLTDGGENRNQFARELQRYEEETGKSPILAMIEFKGTDPNVLQGYLRSAGYTMQVFPFTGDYYIYDQVAALLGGPPVSSILDLIVQTEIPRILGVRCV